jgi:hypothetical protein
VDTPQQQITSSNQNDYVINLKMQSEHKFSEMSQLHNKNILKIMPWGLATIGGIYSDYSLRG